MPAGKVGLLGGPMMASSTSLDVIIPRDWRARRISAAWARSHPLAALYITQIQTIVSREQDPHDPTVVTVGDIHGGTKRNIIPQRGGSSS